MAMLMADQLQGRPLATQEKDQAAGYIQMYTVHRYLFVSLVHAQVLPTP